MVHVSQTCTILVPYMYHANSMRRYPSKMNAWGIGDKDGTSMVHVGETCTMLESLCTQGIQKIMVQGYMFSRNYS